MNFHPRNEILSPCRNFARSLCVRRNFTKSRRSSLNRVASFYRRAKDDVSIYARGVSGKYPFAERTRSTSDNDMFSFDRQVFHIIPVYDDRKISQFVEIARKCRQITARRRTMLSRRFINICAHACTLPVILVPVVASITVIGTARDAR